MNSFSKSSVLYLAGALLLVALVSVRADTEPETQLEIQPAEEHKVPEQELSVGQPEELQVEESPVQEQGTLAKKITNRGKLFKLPVRYNGDEEKDVEFRYKETKSSLSDEDAKQVSKWIAEFKSILINFLSNIKFTRSGKEFNKNGDLDKEIDALVDSMKSTAASIVDSELYKSNKDLQLQVKAAFELLHARAPMTRDRVSELKSSDKFSIEDIQIWADLLEATFTDACESNWTCSLSSVKIDGVPVRNILHWYEDMLTQMGFGKAVESIQKVAFDILQTL